MATIAISMMATSAFAQVGAAPMAFELAMIDGSKFVRLADYSGKPVLLNFWGSECPPCLKEMPLLSSESKQHPAVQFLGIAVDDRASAIRFLGRYPSNYPQLVAPKSPEVLMRRFGNALGALPYTVVLNAQHQICTTHLGEVDAHWVEAAFISCGTVDKSVAGNRSNNAPSAR